MLKFKLIDKCWQEATGVSSDDADFFLEKNEWDDYGYHTMYHLHATNKLTSEGECISWIYTYHETWTGRKRNLSVKQKARKTDCVFRAS